MFREQRPRGVQVLLGMVFVGVAAECLVHGQNLLSSYRGAAQAYRDAANKAPADRRPCYLRWAAYYEAYASAVERGGAGMPSEPTEGPECLGSAGGAAGALGGGTGMPQTRAGAAAANLNAAFAPILNGVQQIMAERSAERHQNLAAAKQYYRNAGDRFEHRLDDFHAEEHALKDLTDNAEMTQRSEGMRLLAEAQRRAASDPVPAAVRQSHPGITPEEYHFFNLLQGSTNEAAWATYLSRYPQGAYADVAKQKSQDLDKAVEAKFDAILQMQHLAYNTQDLIDKTCTPTKADAKDSGSCHADLLYLYAGYYGFCEAHYEMESRSSAAKKDCHTDTGDAYRFSLAEVNASAITVTGSTVVLPSLRPVVRTRFTGQAGLNCPAHMDTREEAATSIPIRFPTSSAAQEARSAFQTVASFCTDAYHPSSTGSTSVAATPAPSEVSASAQTLVTAPRAANARTPQLAITFPAVAEIIGVRLGAVSQSAIRSVAASGPGGPGVTVHGCVMNVEHAWLTSPNRKGRGKTLATDSFEVRLASVKPSEIGIGSTARDLVNAGHYFDYSSGNIAHWSVSIGTIGLQDIWFRTEGDAKRAAEDLRYAAQACAQQR